MTSFANLRTAAGRALRGKRETLAGATFLHQLEPNLLRLERELTASTWQPAPARQFVLHDPKLRTITAVPFEDRVVHHALIGPLEPVFERHLVAHTFACRRGHGTHRALAVARRLVRGGGYALKLDVAAFFASLRHEVVLATLRRLVKDGAVLDLARTILAGSNGETTRGLPIGSLTSQWFANVTLGRLDHFVREQLRPRGYVRYMDDFVLFDSAKERLQKGHRAVATFLREELDLGLKDRTTRLAPVHTGLPFLGFGVFPGTVRVLPQNLRRYRWRLRFLRWRFEGGSIDAACYRQGVAAVMAHLRTGNTLRLRQRMLADHTLEL